MSNINQTCEVCNQYCYISTSSLFQENMKSAPRVQWFFQMLRKYRKVQHSAPETCLFWKQFFLKP